MIDSVLSQENKMFRDVVRKFAEEKIAPNVRAWEKAGQYPDEYYRYLAEMGFMGLLVPEEYSGSGGSMIDLAILCEEMGRVGVSIPLDGFARFLSVLANTINTLAILPLEMKTFRPLSR